MKAIQITAPSEMKVVDIEKPVLEPGEVLVKIKYFCHLQIFSTVFSLWRPVEAGHGFACDIFIQSFHTLKFSGKCLLCCNLGHVGVMESMVADGMTFF